MDKQKLKKLRPKITRSLEERGVPKAGQPALTRKIALKLAGVKK